MFLRQRNLLLQNEVTREENDFYPYRYLAAEGFLPGYNFPALPLRAWVPRRIVDGEYISRPRFVALREFVPHNRVYHEGAKWQVSRFQSPPGKLADRCRQLRICNVCSTFTEVSQDACPTCGTLFSGDNSTIFPSLLEMPNVLLKRHEKITCNEEERLRGGYAISMAFRFAENTQLNRITEARISDRMDLTYAPNADILLINHGWRKSERRGFRINLDTGEIVNLNKDGEPSTNPSEQSGDWVHPFVQDSRNLLRLRIRQESLRQDEEFMTTLMCHWNGGLNIPSSWRTPNWRPTSSAGIRSKP